MSVVPTLDEVQGAVTEAAQLIVGSLKSVEQWSITFSDAGEVDQRPTTSGTVRPITGSALIT